MAAYTAHATAMAGEFGGSDTCETQHPCRPFETHPAVILLDLMMPVMDGVEFRRQQRALPRSRDIPVVCLSARHDAGETANELGFASFVSKPFDLDTVMAAIRQLCAA